MTNIKEFISSNFKTLIVVISFVITMYVQHVTNTAQIVELKTKCVQLEMKVADQYEKIDAIKLDKAVFEATMTQIASMRSDLQEMRNDIKELLKSKR